MNAVCGLSHTAQEEEVIECGVLPLRTETTQAHTIPGLQNKLGSVNQMDFQGYISIFDGQKVSIYDSHNTKIRVSQAAVLERW